MGFVELTLIAIGLSMDAFAVALCKGLNMRRIRYNHTAIIALFFGGFQAFMPLIGWVLGKQFEQYIVAVDHWIAFALLCFIGIKMMKEAREKENVDTEKTDQLDLKELTIMAIATSIDALAVGITFAFLNIQIVPAVSLIGIITFVFCFLGVIIGNNFGMRFKEKAEMFGGLVLVLIGTKILLEHLQLF